MTTNGAGAPDAPNVPNAPEVSDGTPNGQPAPAGPVAVVAAHGDLAAGLVSAVAQITGQGALLAAMSNRGRGPAELEAELRALVDAAPVRAVFTDLPGGSCTMAARRVQRDRPDLVLATGVNLAALLEFVCAATTAGEPAATPDVVGRALERGRASLVALGGAPAKAAPATATRPG